MRIRLSTRTPKSTVSAIFFGILIALVWLLPVHTEWHYSAVSEPPMTQAYERIGLLGNFEVAYTVPESPNHSLAFGSSLKQAARVFFPVMGAETVNVSPRPPRIFWSVLVTIMAVAAFRRLVVFSAPQVGRARTG